MSVHEVFPDDPVTTGPPDSAARPASRLGQVLDRQGIASARLLIRADAEAHHSDIRLADHLRRTLFLPASTIAAAEAQVLGCGVVDPVHHPPEPALIHRLGAGVCLRSGVLPWRKSAGVVVILTCRPEQIDALHDRLVAVFGRYRIAVTTEELLQLALRRAADAVLIDAAETLTPIAESCRAWSVARARRIGAIAAALLALWAVLAPGGLIATAVAWAVLAMALNMGQKLAAAITLVRAAHRPAPEAPLPDRLPVVTIFLPLFKEREIAGQLVANLSKLDYPPDLLDVCILLEEDDLTTRATLARTTLPRWMRAIVVPKGAVKTKPRAMNYGLRFARGSIVGIYDAEDAPEPDQIRKMVRQFAASPPEVVCLQGILDYYNTGTNWLSRCFTVEYTTWFRLVLPGLARMGFVVPLGGTTLFFRRNVLEELGGWDAHNVTEDADLGVRLARHGYRTELLDSVTYEEANCRAWPWIKQRSRWLKGYAITYFVHMRDPVRLWRELGTKRFIGIQMLFLGTLSQFALTPLLWSFWAVPLGMPHPLAGFLGHGALLALGLGFLTAEAMNIALSVFAVARAGKGGLVKWVPTLHFYFPLAVLATYKGLVELFWKPFYWDKTAHGLHVGGSVASRDPRPAPRRAAAA